MTLQDILDAPVRERAAAKAAVLSRLVPGGRASRGGVEMEIVASRVRGRALELYVRATERGSPLALGPGRVRTERVLFINPPCMVPSGHREVVDRGVRIPAYSHSYDPSAALWATLAATVRRIRRNGAPTSPDSVGRSTLSAWPDAGSGGTTVDGIAFRSESAESFAALIAGAGNLSEVMDGTLNLYLWTLGGAGTDQFTSLTRGIFTFDTSPIGLSDTIDAATFGIITGLAPLTQLGDTTVEIVAAAPASANNVVPGDYESALGAMSFGNWLLSATLISNGGINYNDVVMNAAGRANVNKGGITGIGMRLGWDLAGAFTGTWAADAQTRFFGLSADGVAGTIVDPRLVVEFTGGGGPTPPALGTLPPALAATVV